MSNSKPREFWIHCDQLRNLNDEWFHDVVIATRNMWDEGQVICLVDKSDYDKLKAENEAFRAMLVETQQDLASAKELIGKLREVVEAVVEINDDECYFDHHGYCQAHNLEQDCHVKKAKDLKEQIKQWEAGK